MFKKIFQKMESIMVQLAKKLHIWRYDNTYQTASIYTTESECPAPNLKLNVDGVNCYVKLGDINSPLATNGRVYRYSDAITYAILSSAQTRDFPVEWGAFQSIDFTATLTFNWKDWCYAWVLHFANCVLPMRIGKNDGAPIRDDSLYISGSWPSVNSIAGIEGGSPWQAAIAKDASTALKWRDKTNNTTINMISYTDATIMGFNYGNNSVYTTPFSASVNNGVLYIYKNGNLFKTYLI
jgi:hypothetical protein